MEIWSGLAKRIPERVEKLIGGDGLTEFLVKVCKRFIVDCHTDAARACEIIERKLASAKTIQQAAHRCIARLEHLGAMEELKEYSWVKGAVDGLCRKLGEIATKAREGGDVLSDSFANGTLLLFGRYV